jgi:hypothetical protein
VTDTINSAPRESDPDAVRSSTVAYSVEQNRSDSNTADILRLWQSGLTHSGKPLAKFDWYYRRNVQGAPAIFFLNHEGSDAPVGVAAIGKREMYYNGKNVRCGALVDFVTAVEHRTLFPALLLQKDLLRQGLTSHEVLYGLPNAKSLAVVRRAGYSLVGQMIRRARVLRSATYIARYVPIWLSKVVAPVFDTGRQIISRFKSLGLRSFRSVWLEAPDSRFDTLWQNVALADVLVGRRDCAFLDWRFSQNPMRSHKFFALTHKDSSELVAYAACEIEDQTLHVRDFLADPGIPGSLSALLRHLIAATFDRGLSTISVEFLGKSGFGRDLEAAGLRQRGARPMYAAVCPQWPILLDESHWYLTSADEDW